MAKAKSSGMVIDNTGQKPTKAPKTAKPAKRVIDTSGVKTAHLKGADVRTVRMAALEAGLGSAAGEHKAKVLATMEWGKGTQATRSEIEAFQHVHGQRVKLPNGHVLESTWYRPPTWANEANSTEHLRWMEKTYKEWHAAKTAAQARGVATPAVGQAVVSSAHGPLATAKRADLLKIGSQIGGYLGKKTDTEGMRRWLQGYVGANSSPAMRSAVEKATESVMGPKMKAEAAKMEQLALKNRLATKNATAYEVVGNMRKAELVKVASHVGLIKPDGSTNYAKTDSHIIKKLLRPGGRGYTQSGGVTADALKAAVNKVRPGSVRSMAALAIAAGGAALLSGAFSRSASAKPATPSASRTKPYTFTDSHGVTHNYARGRALAPAY